MLGRTGGFVCRRVRLLDRARWCRFFDAVELVGWSERRLAVRV